MRPSAGWILLALLGCCCCGGGGLSQSPCPCDVQLKTVCGAEDVDVPCPGVGVNDVTFSLFRDREVISKVACAGDNGTLNCTSPPAGVGFKVEEEGGRRRSADFVLLGGAGGNRGSYRCEGVATFPPPLQNVPSAVIILVEGSTCKCKEASGGGDDRGRGPGDRIWIAAVALLSCYGVAVTIVAIAIWVRKKRNEDSQSDYMNTKPRGPRDGRKKRGAQKPIPRHF